MTFVVGAEYGLREYIKSTKAMEVPIFPQTKELLLTSYTGVPAIDRTLTTLVIFFAPMVDFNNTASSLFSIFGLGQFAAAWGLLVMESMRIGNAGRLIS